MNQPIDIQALREPSPDRSAFVDTIAEALDLAIERDVTSLRAILWYAHVHPNGIQDRKQQSRRPEFPVDSSNADNIADQIVSTYIDRAPGDGFHGRIIIVLEDSANPGSPPLGTFERLVQIGDPNIQTMYHQQQQGGWNEPPGGGGAYLPPPSGGTYHAPQMHEMDRGYTDDPSSMGEAMNEEERNMALAISAANERRLDMHLRDKHFMLEQLAATNHSQQQMMQYFLQLNALVMGRALPALDFRASQQAGNPLGEIIGAIIGQMLGGGGNAPEPTETPAPPSPRAPQEIPYREDAYRPYEPPPMGGPVEADDITEDMAQQWASKNPDAAKRVAKGLLPPGMQKLIPK